MVWKPRRKQPRSPVVTPKVPELRGCLKNAHEGNKDRVPSPAQDTPKPSAARMLTRKLSRRAKSIGKNGSASSSNGNSIQDSSVRSAASSSSSRSSRKSSHSVSTGRADNGNRETSSSANSDTTDASPNKSASGTTASSASSEVARKSVRFGQAEFRNYERIVGDNPSCSCGAPISIGWNYIDTTAVDVIEYENSRSRANRRIQSGLVLSREQREEILTQWGVSFSEIVDAVRSNIRAKSQRRQTVTNLGKMQKIEEAFEKATKYLKRTLLLQRRTGDKVRQLQEQAELAASAFSQLKYVEERTLSEIRSPKGRVEREPDNNADDQLNSLAVKVEVSNFCRTSPMDTRVRLSGRTNDNTDAVSVGAGSNTDRTTPSAMEMERFHRELEMEMFGDEEHGNGGGDRNDEHDNDRNVPPSMVGQTVEVCSHVEIDDDITMAADLQSVKESYRPVGGNTANREPSEDDVRFPTRKDSLEGFRSLYEDVEPIIIGTALPESLGVMPKSFPAHIYQSDDQEETGNMGVTDVSLLSVPPDSRVDGKEYNRSYGYGVRRNDIVDQMPAYSTIRPQGWSSASNYSYQEYSRHMSTIHIPPRFPVNGGYFSEGKVLYHADDDDDDVPPVNLKSTPAGADTTEARVVVRLHGPAASREPTIPAGAARGGSEEEKYGASLSPTRVYSTCTDSNSRGVRGRQKGGDGNGGIDGIPAGDHTSASSESEGPKIRHTPPPTYLTPSHWMEDDSSDRPRPTYESIVISEDSVMEPPSAQPFFSLQRQPTFTFPASYY